MICKNCSRNFEIDKNDRSVYKKFNVPEPTMCTDCRRQRRMAWRNERVLYKRKCDLCKKDLISNHHSDVPFPVYCSECWWSDKLDQFAYARDFDFSKPFFEQFKLLLNKVPRINLSASNNENCDYVNYTNYSKDCYLVYGGHHSEKCFYCWRVHDSIGCFDCGQCNNCQYSYECMDCDNCYKLVFGQMCQNCDNSYYLYNCKSCSECFMCCNLIHKKYCIFNEQYSREDYERKTKELLGMQNETLQGKFQQLKLKYPHKALNIVNCKDCTGDYLVNCDNCKNTYSGKECKDCRNSYMNERARDCTDGDMVGWPAELCYESISTAVNAFMNLFSSVCWTCNNIYYCDLCFNSGNLFGCVGLNRKNFCILNKQYSENEYKNIVAKITAHMIQTGEYGEFFPINISPFAYNETIALEHYPLTKEEALNKGYKWKDRADGTRDYSKAETCIKCNKSFKILKSEKDFYENISVAVPRVCPNCRHQDRIALRNPRQLYERVCAKCGTAMQTTYAPDRPETVYCEKCYFETVY